MPFILPGSKSILISKGLTEQTHHLTNLSNDPQDIGIPASLTPSLPSQLSPTQTLSEGNSNDISHVSSYFQSRQSGTHTDLDPNPITS